MGSEGVGISIRHADSVDVCFLATTNGETLKRVVVLSHPEVLAYTKRRGTVLSDTWCSRLGAFKLTHAIENGEDMEKDLVTVSPADLKSYAKRLADPNP